MPALSARVVIVGGGISRRQRRVPPDAARLARRGAAGAGEPLRRDHVARGGPGRPAPLLQQLHPADPLQRRSLQPARGPDRPGHGLEALRQRERGPDRGAHDPAQAQCRDGQCLRRRGSRDQPGRGGEPLPADAHRRPGRRGVDPGRRQGQPGRHHPGPGARRPRGRGAADGRRQGHRRQRGQRRGRPGVETSAGPIATEILVNCAGHVGARARAHERRDDPAARLRAHVHRHPAHPGRDRRSAGAARSRRPHLRQGGGGRPPHGRLRSVGQAVGRRRHPGRLSRSGRSRRTGTSSTS